MVYYKSVTVLHVKPSSFEISLLCVAPKAVVQGKKTELSVAAFKSRLAICNTWLR